MIQNMRASQIIFLILFFCDGLHAQSIRLPFDGYYRPGEYMPVAIESAGPVTMQTDGAMNTRTTRSGIAPIFTMSATADQLKAGEQSVPIRALQSDEKLIGFTGQRDAALAKELFPNKHVVFGSLDASNPFPGPACAWSSLDAAVLDAAAPKNLTDLLAAGMTIVVRATDKPDSIWPWRRVRDAWVLQTSISPARPSLLGEDAYLPTESWTPTMPAELRRAIVLIAMLIACLMLATALLQPRWRLAALAGVAIISCGAIAFWKIHQPVAREFHGRIQIDDKIKVQDQWTYESAPRATEIKIPTNDVTYPVFASPAHAAMMHALFDADRGQIICQLPAHAMMAFVTRSIGNSPPLADAIGAPFAPLARQAYLTPGAQLDIDSHQIIVKRLEKAD